MLSGLRSRWMRSFLRTSSRAPAILMPRAGGRFDARGAFLRPGGAGVCLSPARTKNRRTPGWPFHARPQSCCASRSWDRRRAFSSPHDRTCAKSGAWCRRARAEVASGPGTRDACARPSECWNSELRSEPFASPRRVDLDLSTTEMIDRGERGEPML